MFEESKGIKASFKIESEVDDKKACDKCLAMLLDVTNELIQDSAKPLSIGSSVSNQRLSDLSEVLTHEITRFVVFVSKSPEIGTILPSVEKLVKTLNIVSCEMRVMLAPPAGPTLRSQVTSLANRLFSGLGNIVQQLRALVASGKEVPAHLTGMAWAHLAELNKCPLTNAAAVGKELASKLTILKDSREEMGQLSLQPVNASEESKEGKQDGDDDEDDEDEEMDDDDFQDDEEGQLTPEEYAVVVPSQQICTVSMGIVKQFYMYVLKCKFNDSDEKDVSMLEESLKAVSTLCQNFDQLGSALYSPQDAKAITSSTKTIVDTTMSLLSSLASHNQFEAVFPSTLPKSSAASSSSDSAQSISALWISRAQSKLQELLLNSELSKLSLA